MQYISPPNLEWFVVFVTAEVFDQFVALQPHQPAVSYFALYLPVLYCLLELIVVFGNNLFATVFFQVVPVKFFLEVFALYGAAVHKFEDYAVSQYRLENFG